MSSAAQKPRIVVVCGPTGIGKTSTAIAVAEAVGGAIVGADSMQIYRHMDIGTAKPTAVERSRVPHHLIDIVDPDEPFDAARYAEAARKVIETLIGQQVVPIVAGGTGLYIKALVHGIFPAPSSDPDIRRRLKEEQGASGTQTLYRRLMNCDPRAAARIHPNDAFRIIRALEVLQTTGRSITAHHDNHGFSQPLYDVIKIGLQTDRSTLYERIDRRVDRMLDIGLEDEVRGLLRMGYDPELKSMRSIGYRHMADTIQGRLPLDEALRTMKRDTRRYAKRQMTWFKADAEVRWAPFDQVDDTRRRVAEFLQGGL